MKNIVFYHANCTDGFGAAFVVYKLIGNDNAEYIPCNYNEAPPLKSIYEGQNVTIVDFSFPLDVMQDIVSNAYHTTWLDHHKTAFEAIGKNPDELYNHEADNHSVMLDTSRSGALLAFNWYFEGSAEAPVLIRHIDDRDRWQFKMEGTREFHAALQDLKPWTFEQWAQLDYAFHLDPRNYNEFIDKGRIILAIERKQIESAATKAGACTVCGLPGLAVNATMHMSEIGHALANKSGTYGLIYFIDETGAVKCSLRSEGDYDVSAIAKQFGGGGHKNAAGFTTDLATLGTFLKS